MEGPLPGRDTGSQKPSAAIKPPSATKVTHGPQIDAREQALLEMERSLIEEQARRQIADVAKQGNATDLKQLIVMLGPMDVKISRAASPPVTRDGKLAIIGLKSDKKIGKSLEQFFGAPLTPDRQKELLETVKTQLAGKGKEPMNVSVAGWWPKEGVMAVSLVPKG